MSRNLDIMFMAEYIKNVLYFATVREGRVLNSTFDTHYFSIDNELVYDNYYSDFGPLNLGCIYKYCRILNEKLKQHLNKQTIVHYTSINPAKKANSALLLGCYGVLYLSLNPKDALKPLLVHGQSYRPFQDAVQGESEYTISLMDCLQAIKKAQELGFFNFNDFNYEEYDKLDKIQGGDLNWIVPGKFLAFIGPVDNSVSLYHPPEMYIDYFMENNVRIVIRLNKKMYDARAFTGVGISHYDLFFPDGSCPCRHHLYEFLRISEESNCAIAVHCKAGLGRTGSLIGCYLIKHYQMTSREGIAWMRICRPGSVIGHQQGWLEKLEAWLWKQGNLYRKRRYQDTERFPHHEFGVYSIVERNIKKKPVLYKSPSPPPPMQKVRSDIQESTIRPQNARVKEALNKASGKEYELRMKTRINSIRKASPNSDHDTISNMSNRNAAAAAGDLKAGRPSSRTASRSPLPRDSNKFNESKVKTHRECNPVTTFRTRQAPVMKSVHDAKHNPMRNNNMQVNERGKQLNLALVVTPRHPICLPCSPNPDNGRVTPSSYSTATKSLAPPTQRRRLGRSPSPPARSSVIEQIRAKNSPSPTEKFLMRDASKTALKDILSRLKLMTTCRDGSLGAASLGATREAPAPRRAPSVRSDERPLATQGDMLNSIKLQRRLRETLFAENSTNTPYHDSLPPKKPSIKTINTRTTDANKNTMQEYSGSRDKQSPVSRNFYHHSPSRNFQSPSQRPMSPKGRRHPPFY